MEPTVILPPTPLVSHSRPVEYAGFWRRFAAYLIDAALITIGSIIIVLPFVLMFGMGILSEIHSLEEGYSDTPSPMFLAFLGGYLFVMFLLFIAQWLYFALMESTRGATLGKMALRLRVTDMEGKRISFARATGRYFGKILSGLTLTIGYLIAAWTQQKQALHDILAGCLVISDY